jgi:predicted nucleic acid-binding protein
MTDEERELANIEREIQELQEKREKLLKRKDKDYAKSLIDCCESLCIEELDGRTIISLK